MNLVEDDFEMLAVERSACVVARIAKGRTDRQGEAENPNVDARHGESNWMSEIPFEGLKRDPLADQPSLAGRRLRRFG